MLSGFLSCGGVHFSRREEQLSRFCPALRRIVVLSLTSLRKFAARLCASPQACRIGCFKSSPAPGDMPPAFLSPHFSPSPGINRHASHEHELQPSKNPSPQPGAHMVAPTRAQADVLAHADQPWSLEHSSPRCQFDMGCRWNTRRTDWRSRHVGHLASSLGQCWFDAGLE